MKPRHCAFGLKIRQERKMQFAILAERCVAPGSVNRNAQYLRAQFLELGKHLIVQPHLVPADRTPIGRIKSEYHRPSAKLVQSDNLIGSAMKREIRGGRTGR